MSCIDCSPSSLPSQVYSFQYTMNPNCSNPSNCTSGAFDSKCVAYTAVALSCSGIAPNDSIETALQKMDALVCQASGDYSTYNVHCLTTPVTTEADFVDKVTDKLCTVESTITTFIDTTFVAYQTTVTDGLANTQLPTITCVTASVISSDNLASVLGSYCTKFASIDTALDISSVTWNACFTVSVTPTTIAAGFSLLADQICQVKNSSGSTALPTFNNTGSCLSTTGSTDTLVSTVNALRTRVCQSPTFDINALTWGCIAKPSSTTTNIQTAFQSVLTQIDTLTHDSSNFSGDFVVTNVDDSNLCLGKNIALATPLNLDRFVASNSDDTSPGTLMDKLEAGDNITLDDITTPGKIIVSSTASDESGRVFADSIDDTLGFLDDKLEGFAGDDLTVTTTYDSIAKKVKISAALDKTQLIIDMFSLIAADTSLGGLLSQFCTLMALCPSPCQPPQNIQAIFVPTTTTTSTTTTSGS